MATANRVKICRDPALKAKNPLSAPNPAFATTSARLISDSEYAEIVSDSLSVSLVLPIPCFGPAERRRRRRYLVTPPSLPPSLVRVAIKGKQKRMERGRRARGRESQHARKSVEENFQTLHASCILNRPRSRIHSTQGVQRCCSPSKSTSTWRPSTLRTALLDAWPPRLRPLRPARDIQRAF